MDTGCTAKRLIWGVIAVLACALCYSIGFQSGWSDATVRSDQRLDQFNSTFQEVNNQTAEEAAARSAGETVSAW